MEKNPTPKKEYRQADGYEFAPAWEEAQTKSREHKGCEPLAQQKNEEMPDVSTSKDYTRQEIVLGLRNHGHHPEGCKWDITPLGMHYLLIHFDIPKIDADTYSLKIGGAVEKELTLSLEDIKSRPSQTIPVMMECGGTGRVKLFPRPIVWPWKDESIGCYQWTGTPLRGILEEAGLKDEALEILFTGHDRGFDQGFEHNFERSLPISEAMREEVMLVWAHNDHPLMPQHGAPLRLIVPHWYGMTSVKWLKSITAITEPFRGVQQAIQYRYKRPQSKLADLASKVTDHGWWRNAKDDPGEAVTRIRVNSTFVPPGMPDLIQRNRYLVKGKTLIEGRAWSGFGPIKQVEFSSDGGKTWQMATLGETVGEYAWTPFRIEWNASKPGEYELCTRATDAAGNSQPIDSDEVWNYGGYGVNAIQRVPVFVCPP